MKFRSKLTICMIMLTSIIYGIGGMFLITLSFNGSLKLEEEQAIQTYDSLRSTLILVNDISEQNTEQDVADTLKKINENNSQWYAVRLYSGERTFYRTARDFEFDREMSVKCSEDKCAMRVIETENGKFQQLTGSFRAGNTKMYLDAVREISDVYVLRDSQIKIYKALFLAVTLISAAISFLTANFLTVPMRHLSRISQRIADGDLKVRSIIHSGDEMETLSDNFNLMAESLTRKIQELEEHMEQQQRFMGSFAHELKTPMTSMIGYADLMRSCELPADEQRECAEYIFKEGKRLERLSFKLLDLLVLKKQDFTLHKAFPSKLALESADTIKEKFDGKDIIIDVETKEGECFLEIDLVRSLLLNLLDNSVKAIDDKGKIILSQSMLQDGCCFSIKDNGRGMPAEELDKITEAFYRVDKSRSRRQGGAGLGLSLCAEIVKLHNGDMRFISEVGKGTEIIVELRGGKERKL